MIWSSDLSSSRESPGADLQGVTHGFGQDDAASLIDSENGIHNGVLPLNMPVSMPFLDRWGTSASELKWQNRIL
jgi:hypothetical protein